MAGRGQGERNPDPGSRLILEELRDLRLEMRADRRLAEDERRRSEERFGRIMRDFRQDLRTVGLSIVKTLNHHTRILERIDRKLGARRNGRPGQENGGGASPGR